MYDFDWNDFDYDAPFAESDFADLFDDYEEDK